MNIDELKQIQNAPEQGWMLVYTRKKVEFKEYLDVHEVQEQLKNEEVLELHLFDPNREYRVIQTKSKRSFENSAEGTIECIVPSAEELQADTYEETVLLENAFQKGGHQMTMVNYLEYDQQGMVRVSNYRLKMEV